MNTSLVRSCALTLAVAAVATALVACGGSTDPTSAVGTAVSAKAPTDAISSKPLTLTENTDSSYTSVGVSGNRPMEMAMDPKTATVHTTSFCGIADFDAAMLAAVNAARASSRSCGSTPMAAVGPLAYNAQLTSAASRHSLDMAKVMKLDHTGSDGSSFSERITDAGYGWSDAGENVAWNQRSIPEVIESWLQSPGHCTNIMSGARTEFGGACEKAGDGSYYWTQVFAAPAQ